MNAITAPQSTELAIVWPYAEDVIKELAENYKNLVISDAKTYDATRAARTEMVSVRTSIDKALKAGNAPLKAAMDANRDEAKRLIELAAPTEAYLQEQVKTWEAKKEAEKQAKIQAERDRVAAIRARIAGIGAIAAMSINSTPAEIVARIDQLTSITVDDGSFDEFGPESCDVYFQALDKLHAHLAARNEFDRQESERKAEAERLRQEAEKQAQERAAFRAEQAAAQAVIKAQQEAIAAREREIADKAKAAEIAARKEREKIERQRLEFEQRQADAARAEQDRLDAIEAVNQSELAAQAAAEMAETETDEPVAMIDGMEGLSGDYRATEITRQIIAEEPRPSNVDIIDAVAERFGADFDVAQQWIIDTAAELIGQC
jgi:hypothetical protein